MNANDTTPERVATLHSLLDDAAKRVGEQRQTINELRAALEMIGEFDGDQPSRSAWDALRIARAVLAKSGAPQ